MKRWNSACRGDAGDTVVTWPCEPPRTLARRSRHLGDGPAFVVIERLERCLEDVQLLIRALGVVEPQDRELRGAGVAFQVALIDLQEGAAWTKAPL